MKGLFIYRILSFFVNLLCALFAFSLVMAIPAVLANPGIGILVFIMLGVVLYGWYANKFLVRVILMKDTITRRQKDWLQVNAIVALVVCVSAMINGFTYILHPNLLDDMVKQLSQLYQNPTRKDPSNLIRNTVVTFLVFFLVLFIHIVWTLLLVRANKQSIEDNRAE